MKSEVRSQKSEAEVGSRDVGFHSRTICLTYFLREGNGDDGFFEECGRFAG